MNINKQNLAEQVSNILKKKIIEGHWTPGDKIPSENEMASMFGVSRLTIRLALQRLNSLGIVETRIGEGTFVKEFSFEWYVNEIADIMMEPRMLDDVRAFRSLIELESIRLLISNTTPRDISKLEASCAKFLDYSYKKELSIEENVETYIKLDYEFHYLLCEASKNTLLLLAFLTAKEPILQYLRLIVKSRFMHYENGEIFEHQGNLKKNAEVHCNLLNAIKENNFQKCKEIYLNLVDYQIVDYLTK